MKIPLYRPYIDKREKDAVLKVLSNGKLARGKEVEKFEYKFKKILKKKYAVAVNSGTSGLQVAVKALGWVKGDEVITTPFSFIASGNALLHEGVKPIFVDIDLNTLNIDVRKVEEKISSKTKGIMLVDIFGLPNNAKEIESLKLKYNLKIIEDACEAIGRPEDSFSVGRTADVTVFGFHENKQITTLGEGGMIVTDDEGIAKRSWSIRDQGRSTKKNWIQGVTLGFNMRMTEAQATFGNVQLLKLNSILKYRNHIAKKYNELLCSVPNIMLPNIKQTRSWFQYFIICKSNAQRQRIHKFLKNNGVDSSINYFPPIYKFPQYKHLKNTSCKNAEMISRTLLVLPMFYGMTDKEIEFIVGLLKKICS